MGKQAIIIGAGPAGLTAAYELLKRTDIKPIILEKSSDIGGISKTIKYKGNRMDIGGHRFFSKSDRVMNWWLNIMPLEKTGEESVTINYQNKTRSIPTNANNTGEPTNPGLVMLLRKRLSRIYFLRKFFNYPIQLSIDTLRKLGLIRTIRILLSYLFAQLVPRKPEKSLEDFLINRFGRELYLLFFKDYTEKVWGVPCNEISAEWGAQRIKGVSISKAIQHAAQMMMKKKKKASGDISQKDTETSLIEQFLYPALGPGQLWEEVARQIEVLGGTILMHQNVKSIDLDGDKVKSVVAVSSLTGEETTLEGDYFFSTMPVQELIAGMKGSVPTDVKEIAAGLQYRDFITVGILLEKLSTADNQTLDLKDTWIYIQERDVKVGRLQLFNNWSPYMVNKPGTVWIGMEYFCNEGDDFWRLTDEEIKRTAVAELEKMGLAQVQHVLDSTVHRVEKTYPAYFGTYNQFDKIRAFTDQFANLFLVGRNGMHKYNNADHSMLTAMVSVDNIAAGVTSKENIWAINTEQEYHEEKAMSDNKEASKEPSTHYKHLPALVDKPNGFKEFISSSKQNRLYILLASIAIIIQFIIFKLAYPSAGFVDGDSYVYLRAAENNETISYHPVGYSNFLRLFSVFTRSDLILVAFQYFFLQISLLIFVLTVYYFFNPSRLIQIFLLFVLILSPVSLYLSNYIMSDAIFLALSMNWLTSLLWLIHKPTIRVAFFHGIILFLAFTLRYNALIYPVIAAITFLRFNEKFWQKVIGTSFGLTLIVVFIINTAGEYKTLTGIPQFSPFTGWQLANNALYAYREIQNSEKKSVPKRFEALDKIVRDYFDSTRNTAKYPYEKLVASTFYMWAANSPLHIYKQKVFNNDSSISEFRKWATMGQFYKEYGNWLIINYPLTFVNYFLTPNAISYYTPPTEFLSYINVGIDTIQDNAQSWFSLKDKKVHTTFKDLKVNILEFYPILSGTMNVIFVLSLISFLALGGHKNDKHISKGVFLATSFWLMNFCFSVFASSIALRFQLFPLTVVICFGTLLLEYVYKRAFLPVKQNAIELGPKNNVLTI